MPSERELSALKEIKDNIFLAQDFVAAMTLEYFKADPKAIYATVRALEIISEASRKLSDDLKGRHPHLPWKQIAGAGNVYRHDYENVTDRFVWNTVQKSLPALLKAVEAELS